MEKKRKISNKFFFGGFILIALVLLLSFCLATPCTGTMPTHASFAAGTSVFAVQKNPRVIAYGDAEKKDLFEINYNDLTKGEYRDLNLQLTDMNLNVGDTITYLILGPTEKKYRTMFETINVTSSVVTNSGYMPIMEATKFFNRLGEYSIMAVISHGDDYVIASPLNVLIVIPEESKYELKISYSIMDTDDNELTKYMFSAMIYLEGEPISNIDNFVISWYLNGSKEPFRRMNSSFQWQPEEAGIYTIQAKIDGFSELYGEATSEPKTVTVAYNNQTMILLVIGGIALFGLLSVLAVGAIKMHRERVW